MQFSLQHPRCIKTAEESTAELLISYCSLPKHTFVCFARFTFPCSLSVAVPARSCFLCPFLWSIPAPTLLRCKTGRKGLGWLRSSPAAQPCTGLLAPRGLGTGRGTMLSGHWGLRRARREQVGNKQEGKGKPAHCMQSQNQVHLAEPQRSNRATPSAQTIILNNICTRAMKQSYPNAVPPVCLTRKETLLLQQNGSVDVPRYRCLLQQWFLTPPTATQSQSSGVPGPRGSPVPLWTALVSQLFHADLQNLQSLVLQGLKGKKRWK